MTDPTDLERPARLPVVVSHDALTELLAQADPGIGGLRRSIRAVARKLGQRPGVADNQRPTPSEVARAFAAVCEGGRAAGRLLRVAEQLEGEGCPE